MIYNDLEGLPRLSDPARADLQCNILYSTGRFRSKQMFVRFETAADFRQWLRSIPEVAGGAPVTSERDVGKSGEDVNLLFTSAGLRKLRGPNASVGMDVGFQRGSRSPETLRRLRDDPAQWATHRFEWDAALLVHSNREVVIPAPANGRSTLETGNSLDVHGQVINPETAPNDVKRYNVYGYVDGLSTNVYEEPLGGFNIPITNYDPRRKLSTLLTRDPFGSAFGFGSYFVFRKYRQNVEAFENRIEAIAQDIEARVGDETLGVPLHVRFPPFRDPQGAPLLGLPLRNLVRAWIMGRYPDGTPLVPEAPAKSNNFKFDSAGVQCPFHAHIPKMNPRGRTEQPEDENLRSLARRGISYGHRGADETGLLFWCAQARIAEQFEYVQEHWANDWRADHNHRPTPHLDNVIGKRVDEIFEDVRDPYPANPKRYDRWTTTIEASFQIYDTIALEGSEYFFAPSLSGVAALIATGG